VNWYGRFFFPSGQYRFGGAMIGYSLFRGNGSKGKKDL